MARYSILFIAYLFILSLSRPVPDSVVNKVDVTSISKGHPATYSFRIHAVIDVAYQNAFLVTFPPEYTQVSTPLSCHVALSGGNAQRSACSVSNNNEGNLVVSIPSGPVQSGVHVITLSEVVNPIDFPSTSNINVTLALQGGSVQQIIDIEGIPLLPAPVPILDLVVTTNQRFRPDRIRDVTFTVHSQNNRNGRKHVHMRLASGLAITSDTVTVTDHNAVSQTYTGVRTPDSRSIYIYNVTQAFSPNFPLNFTIKGGLTFEDDWQEMVGCTFDIILPDYPRTLETATNLDFVRVRPLNINPSVTPGVVVNGSINTFELTWNSPMAIDSFFDIFIEVSSDSRLVKECQAVEGVSQDARCSVDNNQYQLSNIGSIANNAPVAVNLFIQAPSRRINITINIEIKITIKFRRTGESVATGGTSVDVLIRSSNILRSLTFNSGNVANLGETALLHFFFRFIDALPGTNARTDGKIVLEIMPQIPKPDLYLRKILKCLFFRLHEATECYWDNSDPSKSMITMKTPAQFDYKEVDVEINTYDPNLDKYYGVPLYPINETYYYKVYTFHNNETIPNDIYEEIYQPRPYFLRTLTADITNRNADDNAGLIFTIGIPDRNIVTGRDYFIRLVFDSNSGGFEEFLGFGGDNKAIKYPCWCLREQRLKQPSCMLYTKNAGNAQNEIHIYGNFTFGSNLTMLLPKLKLNSFAPNRNLRVLFSIAENMPGILDNYPNPVDLHRRWVNFGDLLQVASPSNTPRNFLFNVNVTTPQISSVDASVIVNNIPSSSYNHLFLEFGNLNILQNGEDSSDSFFDIIYFTKFNLAWILKKSASPGNSIRFTIPNPIWYNGPWLGPFPLLLRQYSGDTNTEIHSTSVSFDSFFDIFVESSEPDQKLYTNYHHFVNISGLIKVPLEEGSSIVVDLSGFEISDDSVPYCGLGINGNRVQGANILGIKCTRTSATSLLINNFAPISFARGWNITITITIKIKFRTSAGSATVTTYGNADGTNQLEKSRPKPFDFTLLQGILLQNFLMLSEFGPEEQTAHEDLFIFNLIPAGVNITTVKVTFPQNTTIPNGDSQCYINGKVTFCSVNNEGQLSVIFVSQQALQGLTEFQFSPNGQVYNGTAQEYGLEPGYYEILFELFDDSANLRETQHSLIFLRPSEVKEFTARSFVSNINFEDTIWRFRFKLGVPIRDWDDDELPYRIYFEFPTGDGGFSSGIGLATNTFDELPCVLKNNGDPDYNVHCTIIASGTPGTPALLSIANFSDISSNDNIEVWVTGINHPQTMTSYPPVGIIVTKLKYQSLEETLVLAKVIRSRLALRDIATTTTQVSRNTIPIILTSTGPFIPDNTFDALITVPGNGLNQGSFVVLKTPQHIGLTRNSGINCPNGNCFLLSDLKTILLDINTNVNGGSTFNISVQGFASPPQLYWKFLSIRSLISRNRIVEDIQIESYDKAKLAALVGEHSVELKGVDYDHFDFRFTRQQEAQKSTVSWFSQRGVPAGGSIFLRFTPNINLYNGCLSLNYLNFDSSGLQSSHQTPFVGCQVEGDALVIRPRDAASGLPTGKRVHLSILIDTPNTNSLTVDVTTFVSENPDLLLENPIEQGQATVAVRGTRGLSVTSAVPVLENVLLTPGVLGPLEFYFNTNTAFPAGGSLEITFPATGLKGQPSGFNLRQARNWNALVTDSETGEIYPSKVSVRGLKINITITITISFGKKMHVVVDTHNENLEENSGLRWATFPDWYILQVVGEDAQGATLLEKSVPVKISPAGQGSFQISNKASLSSELIIETKFNLTRIPNESTKNLIFNFYGKGNQAAGTRVRAFLRDLEVEVSARSAIVEGGCILFPGQHKSNKVTVTCPLGNNLAEIDDEVQVLFSLPNDLFISDVDLILSSEILIENNVGTILYYHYSPDRVLVKPIPPYENMSHFLIAPLNIQTVSNLTIDVPCPEGLNAGDTISILTGFGYNNALGVSPNFGCSPNCQVTKIDKNLVITATGPLNFGTRLTITGIRNPNFVQQIETSVVVCAYNQNPFLFHAFHHIPDEAESFFTILPRDRYQLTSAVVPNFRKNSNALSLLIEGDFRNSGAFLFQFNAQIPIYKMECYTGLAGQVIIKDCFWDGATSTLVVHTEQYLDFVVRKLHVIGVIGMVGISRRRIYTLGPQLLIFNFYNPPLTAPINRHVGIQYINTFDSSAIEVDTRSEQDFHEYLAIDKYNHFGINKKPTSRDPDCCYWYRFQIFVANANLPNRIDLNAKLLSDQIKITLPFVQYLHPKNDLCFVNNRIKSCTITEIATGINVDIQNIGEAEIVDDAIDVQIGFYIGPTGVIDGFYMLNQDLFRVAVELFPRNSNTVHSNYLSDILVIKPKLLAKFQIQQVLNIVTGQRNAITFRVNNRGYLSPQDKPRYIVEFEVGRNDTHLFDDNLGSFTNGAAVPCVAVSNMEVIGQLHCYFVSGNSYGKFGINARIYVEGFSVPEPQRDVLFRIAGIHNPNTPSSPTFAISLFTLNQFSNYDLIAYNELYGALNVVDNSQLVLRTNPNNNLVDIVGSFFNRRSLYRVTVEHELDEDAWILLEISGNIDFCQFTEDSSMIGFVDGESKRFLQVRAAQHRRGDRYSFHSFVCAQPGDIIKAYIYQADQITGEVIFMQFPNDIDLLALRNRVPVVNDNDVRASLNVNQRAGQTYGVATLSMRFSENFLRDQQGFLLPQYGQLASLQIDISLFDEITNICYVSNGFGSSLPTSVVLCTISPQTGEVIVRNWDTVVLFNNTNPDEIQIVFVAKLKASSYYNTNLRTHVTLQFFADQNAYTGSFPYFNLYVPVRPITYTNNRLLAGEKENSVSLRRQDRTLSDEIYRCRDLSNNVNYRILGYTNSQVVEIEVSILNINRAIGIRNNLAIFTKNWQFSIFPQTLDQIRQYPCLCNVQADCYYYPPKSLNNDSPFTDASLVIDFQNVVRRNDDVICYFPAKVANLNQAALDAVILTDNFIAYDEDGEIRNLGGCEQILATDFVQGNQLNYTISVDANIVNFLSVTLEATLSQFYTNDYVIVNFGSRFLFNYVNQNALCANLNNCRVYTSGTLIVVGNPASNTTTISFNGIRYNGWIDDGSPDTINSTVFTNRGQFRGEAWTNLPNFDLEPLPAVLSLERPSAYIYENILFTLKFRTGDYQIRTFWGGNFFIHNLTFIDFGFSQFCSASSDMGGPWNYWVCQVINSSTIVIFNYWRRTVPANTTFTIQFRGQLTAPPLTTLGLTIRLIRLPGNNGYQRVLNTNLNVTARMNTTVVLPNEEIQQKNIYLWPVLHENYPESSGPLKVKFKAGSDLAGKVKISTFNIPGRYPLCWVNEFNLDPRERLLYDYPFDSFYNFCSLGDNNSSVIIDFPFKTGTQYEIVFTMTNGSRINNLFHLNQIDNVDWDNSFPNGKVNFTLYNSSARLNSYYQKCQPENSMDFKVNRIEVSSKEFDQPKTIWIQIQANRYVPAYPRGVIDINLPDTSFNGMFNGWGANIYNPVPEIGVEIPCDVVKNNLDFGNDRGNERPVCVFHRTARASLYPVTLTVKVLSSLSRGESVNIILYGLLGPNSRAGVASIQFTFVAYPFEAASYVYKKPIDHLFQFSGRGNTLRTQGTFNVPVANQFLQQTGVTATLSIDVTGIANQPLTSPINGMYVEFYLPEFLRKLDHNIQNGTVTLNGQSASVINRDHRNGIIFLIFDPPVVINQQMNFVFGNLEHDIFPCTSCQAGSLTISDGSNIRLFTSVQYPYQLLALPTSVGFFPGSGSLINFNNHNQILEIEISLANAHQRTEVVLIRIPDTQLIFVDCKLIFVGSTLLEYHNCATYQDGTQSVLQLTVSNSPNQANYKIQVDLPGAVPSSLDFVVEEYLTGIMFQTGILPVTISSSYSISGTSDLVLKSQSCCYSSNTVGQNLRLPHKANPRTDTNKFWFKAQYPANFGNSFSQVKVSFLETTSPSSVFSLSQFICAYLEIDSGDGNGPSDGNDMIFAESCVYDPITNSIVVGAPQTSTQVSHTVSWKNTVVYIECFLTGTSCFQGLKDGSPVRVTTNNGRDTILYYSEVALNFKRISFNSFSSNPLDNDFFNFEVKQFGEYGLYKGRLYDKLFVHVAFEDQVFAPLQGKTKKGTTLKPGHQFSVGVDNDCDDRVPAEYPGVNALLDHEIVYPEDMLTRTRHFNIRIPFVKRPALGKQVVVHITISGFYGHELLPNVVANKVFFLQQSETLSSPQTINMNVVASNFIVDNNNVSFNVTFTPTVALDETSLIIYGLTHSTDAISTSSLCGVRLDNVTQDTFVYGNTVYFFSSPKSNQPVNLELEALLELLSTLSSQGQGFFSTDVFANQAYQFTSSLGPIDSEILINNQTLGEFNIVYGNLFNNHTGIYRLTIVLPYWLEFKGSIFIYFPPEFTLTQDLDFFENCRAVEGFAGVIGNENIVQCSKVSADTYLVTGYDSIPPNTRITLQFSLLPNAVGTDLKPIIRTFSSFGLPHSEINNIPGVRIRNERAPRFLRKTFGVRLDSLHPGTYHNLRLAFRLDNAITFGPNDQRQLLIDLDTDFNLDQNTIVWGYYREASSNVWIVVSRGNVNGHQITFNIRNITTLNANTDYDFLITFELGNQIGLLMPPTGRYDIGIQFIINNSLTYISFIQLLVLPAPFGADVCIYNPLVKELSKPTITEVTLKFRAHLEIGDEVWIKLRDQSPDPDITRAARLYPWEIEYPIELSFDDRTSGINVTSVLVLESANDPGTIRVKFSNAINAGTTISFLIPNLVNPPRNMFARARISLMRICRNDLRLLCEILYGEISYRVIGDYSTLVTPSSLLLNDDLVSLQPSEHLVSFNLNEDLNKLDYLLVKYPNPFLTFPEVCYSSMGDCIAFPHNQFALIRLAAPVASQSLATLSLILGNANYQSVVPLNDPLVLEAITMVTCRIVHEFTYPQPDLLPVQHTQFEQKVLNSRNFNGFIPQLIKGTWNTVQFQVDSFFDIWTEVLVIDLPNPEVTSVDDSLCNATLTVPTNPQAYPEPLICVFSGNQVKITPSGNFDRTYALSGANKITFYIKFFVLRNTQSTEAIFSWKGYNADETGLRKEGTSSLVIEKVNIPREKSMDLMRIPGTSEENYDLHLAIDSVTTDAISIIEFELPKEFASNITAQTPIIAPRHCRFTGERVNVFTCYALPATATSGIKIVAIVNNYFGKLTVLRVSGVVPNIIQLPTAPTHEYIGHVTLLRSANNPVETLLTKFNLILNSPLQNVVINTYANADTLSTVSLAFDMGPGGMYPGYKTVANPEHSNIVLEFIQAEGYESLLGYNGLYDPVIDCVSINIQTLNNEGLKCVLKRGTLFSNPEIHISNYEAFAPNTAGHQIIIHGIYTQTLNQKGGVRVSTRKLVNDFLNPSFLSSLPILHWTPERVSLTPTVIERGTFSLVKSGRKWNITITINININLRVNDIIEVTLPHNLFFRDADIIGITSNHGGSVFVFEKVGVLHFTGVTLPTGPYTLQINDVPIPPFTVLQDVEIKTRVIVDNLVQNLHFFTKFVNSTAGTSVPTFSVNLANNQGGFCGNTMDITVNLGYSLTIDGQIRIIVPNQYLRIWNGTDGGCTPQFPFPPYRTCTVRGNQLLITADGIAPPNQDINVRLTNICLPNSQIRQPFYLFAQYNSSNNSIYSVVPLAAPQIQVTIVQDCVFTAESQFPNSGEWSDYTFHVNCTQSLKPRTHIRIRFPEDYADSFGPRAYANDGRCSVHGLIGTQDYCSITIDNFVWIDVGIEDAPASSEFRVVIHDVINPTPNVYRFVADIDADGFIYARSQGQASVNIIAKRIDKSTPLLARSFAAVPPSASQVSSTVVFTTRMQDFNQVAQAVFKFDDDDNFNFEGRQIACRAYLFTDFLTLNLDSYYWRELNNSTESLSCVRQGRNVVVDVSNSLRSSTKHIAWVFDGTRNPSLNSVRPLRLFYLKSNGEVFWSGNLMIDTTNWAPIKPIRLELTTTTNNKQGAFAQMNFTIDPFGGFGGQSEVALHLSNEYGANSNNPSTFCTDDNDDNIDCIQEGLQYSIRNFNGFSNRNRFNYGLINIINPSNPTCTYGADNNEQFHADIVNFRTRGLVYKTFRVLPGDSNCMEYIRRNYTVTVDGPTLVYPGTSNIYRITLEAGSPNFEVQTIPSHPGSDVQPNVVRFNSLFVIQKNFRLNLDLSVPQGPLTLNFITTDIDNTFESIPPMQLTVGDIRNAPNTTIFVESFDSIENNNSPQYLFIYLRRAPPLNLVINIDSNGTYGVLFNPSFLAFNPNTKEGFISVRVPPAVSGNLTLRLTVTGPQGEYVPYVFSRSIITVPIINTNQGVRLDYTLVQKDNIGRNNATVTVCFNKPAFAHFILVGALTTPPTQNMILSAGNGNPLYTASGKVRTSLNAQTNTNCTQLYLHGLDADTEYSLYLVGDDGSVPSAVRRVNFQTRSASNAIILHMFLNPQDDIEQIRLIMASILGVTPDRIIIIPISRRRMLQDGKMEIETIIAPETQEDDEAPATLATKLQSREGLAYLKQKVPSLDVEHISAAEYSAVVPALGNATTVSAESYNSVTFNFNLTGEGEVYGIRVPTSAIQTHYEGSLSLTGLNIYNGVLPNNVQLPYASYKSSGSTTPTSNLVSVGFADVEDGESFTYYFVLADKLNTNPPALSSNIIKIEHTTKKNPYSVNVEL